MKQNSFKIFSIIAVMSLALYFLYPTWQDQQFKENLKLMSSEDSLKFVDANRESIDNAETGRLKLGLDLQGGMYVVLEVDLITLLEKLAKSESEELSTLLSEVSEKIKDSGTDPVIELVTLANQKGIRLSRYYGNIKDENTEVQTYLATERDNAVDRALQILRTRVDQYGVSEPSISKQGASRIIIELPGVADPKRVRSLIKATAALEFKLLADKELAMRVLQDIDAREAAKVAQTSPEPVVEAAKEEKKAEEGILPTDTATPETTEEARRKNPLLTRLQVGDIGYGSVGVAADYDRENVNKILQSAQDDGLIPGDMRFHWSAKPIQKQGNVNFYVLYALERQAEMTGGSIVDARATIGGNFNAPEVSMTMDTDGARQWAILTGANIGKQIAIVLDNTVFSAPRVKNKISGGVSSIDGLDDMQEAKDLENVLKAGALPAPVLIVQERTVGPSLGAESIRQGLWSAIWGLVAVAIVMIIYYHLAGVLANLALVINLIIILGVLAAFQGTLTLPGIAGIILTIGMAVDANVLIFERIREEMATGKTMKAVIESGYDRAWTAIFDANITTFFTGVVLYAFGVGPIQGFALTLMIGIVTSLFTAVVVTRVVLEYMISKPSAKIQIG